MRTPTRAAASIATAALTLLVSTAAPASASVNSGGGQLGWTSTICQESMQGYHSFEASAHVRQEFDGQWVAVRFWVYDARGWVAQDWAMSNDPGWGYDGVGFHGIFNGLQPVSGDAAWLYVQYAWYDANGWRVGGELLNSYKSVTGALLSYCVI